MVFQARESLQVAVPVMFALLDDVDFLRIDHHQEAYLSHLATFLEAALV
jgi:hypothetical protein